jgi:hypothetical protein
VSIEFAKLAVVKSAVLEVGQSHPVYPDKQTTSRFGRTSH